MPTERPWYRQLVGDRRSPCHSTHANNIEARASIPCQSQRSHQMPPNCFIYI